MGVYFSSRTMREMYTFSRAIAQRSRRASFTLALLPGAIAACFSSSCAIFFWCFTSASVRATVAFTRACTTSSVSSSSSKITTSFTLRTPRFRSSPSAAISRITIGEREIAFSTRIWPRSMRLAISTSPSRVSSGTVPISRRYMRTGSLVFSSVPGVRSSSTSSPSSSSKSLSPGNLGASSRSMPWRADGGHQIVQIVGRANLIGQHVVHFAVGQIALLLAGLDQAVHVVFEFVVNRQIIPALFGTTHPQARSARFQLWPCPGASSLELAASCPVPA